MDLAAPFLATSATCGGVLVESARARAPRSARGQRRLPEAAAAYPDLSDPAIRALPISALAVAWAIIDNAQRGRAMI